jgi:hypothetical protein
VQSGGIGAVLRSIPLFTISKCVNGKKLESLLIRLRITRKQIVMLPFVQRIFQRVASRHRIQPF